jgi:hypothetical protein
MLPVLILGFPMLIIGVPLALALLVAIIKSTTSKENRS